MAKSTRTPAPDMRRQILDKAAELFGKKGFEAVSVREIAEACGVSKPALYYHFENKLDLGISIIEQLYTELGEAFDAGIAENEPESPYELVRTIISAYLSSSRCSEGAAKFLMAEFFTGEDSAMLATIKKHDVALSKRIIPYIHQMEENGALRKGSGRGLLLNIEGVLLALFIAHYRGFLRDINDDFISCVAGDIVYGFDPTCERIRQHPELENAHDKTAALWEIEL